jgi:hypothetical protein
MNNEIDPTDFDDVFSRALMSARGIQLTFEDEKKAENWRYNAYRHRKRERAELKEIDPAAKPESDTLQFFLKDRVIQIIPVGIVHVEEL